MEKFQEGKSYYGRFICNYDNIIRVTVARRTAKSVITTEGKTLRIKTMYDGRTEYINPLGNYSMAPMICADRPII